MKVIVILEKGDSVLNQSKSLFDAADLVVEKDSNTGLFGVLKRIPWGWWSKPRQVTLWGFLRMIVELQLLVPGTQYRAIWNSIRERAGRFYIGEDLIREHPMEVAQFLSRFVIYNAKFDFAKRAIEYQVFGDEFAPVNPAEDTPLYSLSIGVAENGEAIDLRVEKEI